MEKLKEIVQQARLAHHMAEGKCSMCAIGDKPKNGLHQGQYHCGNNDTCTLCHNAGMEYGDQCVACGRIKQY